ncbi:MAG: carboxypeptidase regulatory-like domain-containing protein [Deltaproteobacteria bacterium]
MLRLRAAAKLTVTVATSDGKPLDGATVDLRGADHQTQETKAGTAVFTAVVPGGYQIAAWAPGLAHSTT